jgi:two-component system, LytTR family, sensor histidine kinase AgrC
MNFIISSSLILFINFGYFHLLLTRKRSIKYTLLIFIINYLIAVLVCVLDYVFFRGTNYYKYILYILASTFIVYIALVFEESLSKKIFTMFTVWLFSNITLIICSYVINFFPFKDISLYEFPFVLLRAFIELAFIPIVNLYFRRPYKEMLKLVSNKVVNIISFYCIIIYLFLINQFKLYSFSSMSFHELFESLLFVFITVLSYIIIFIAILSINKNMKLEYKLEIIDTQIELQKQNYKTLQKSLENYYSFKHDIKHHLLAIKAMLDGKNYVAASEYMNKFTKNEIYPNVDILCKNFAVDSILKYYMSIAMNDNIDFKVNINIPQEINIEDLDLSIIIGNCVENAIEACSNIIDKTPKYINIKAEIRGLQLVIRIKNSFNGQVAKENNIIKTSKNGQGHGIGLSNVRNIAERYNGFFNVKYNNNEFEVQIIMNYN